MSHIVIDGKRLRARGRRKDQVLVQVFLKADLVVKLRARAEDDGTSMTGWIRRLCIEALRRPADQPTN